MEEAQQRIMRVRRRYNQWVANQTLEDYALRFTAKSARKWSEFRVANTALGAISFLALEAIGGSITVHYGFANAVAAIVAVSVCIFATGLPIAYSAAKYGVDIDLLTRGAGFGYFGSTVTSLIYASFTFLFFAIEAAILSLALEICFGVPLALGYLVSSLLIIPLVTHGITFISRLQMWTQPLWIGLHLLPLMVIAVADPGSFEGWTHFSGMAQSSAFDFLMFGTASTVVFSLVAQIGEQVDFLRFLPARGGGGRVAWWGALLSAGPGWIIPGALKLLVGSFLAFLAMRQFVPAQRATEPPQMYLVAFGYVFSSPKLALAFTGAFVIVSQIKINVTNAYAGSIAWSNFFSRVTHSHPGRVVWLVFNVAIALMLMELGIFAALEHILGLYSIVAVAWVGALVADLVINKPLKLSPSGIEFKRAHLYDVNPVGVGSMLIAAAIGIASFSGTFGQVPRALAPFIALGAAFVAAPTIALLTRGRFYLARSPAPGWGAMTSIRCCICEHEFEPEDTASCPAYAGPICSLCCSLETRCRDCCKQQARFSDQLLALLGSLLPGSMVDRLNSRLGHYLGLLAVFGVGISAILGLIYLQATYAAGGGAVAVTPILLTVFCILAIIAGVGAWLIVLSQEARRVAQEESWRQTKLLLGEIEAHKRTDAKLQRAKETAEAASRAKSRYVVGLSHELRTPLNAILGYAQLLERDRSIPPRRHDAVKVVRRSAEHLSGLIDGLLDISKIEAGRFALNRDEVRIAEFLDQLVGMFRLQAGAKGLDFVFDPPDRLPFAVYTDENRLRQILINLLSNAMKFTDKGRIALRVTYRNEVAEFRVEDSGVGIPAEDLGRIFEPFERAHPSNVQPRAGTGLGLTIAKMLTEIMGGEIGVESELGRGSVFHIKLMLSAVTRPRTISVSERPIRGYRGRPLTVLVADDDPIHRDLIHEILMPLGFTVLSAQDGPSCLKLAEQCGPDLILLDVLMPGMSGWETARRLREAGHVKTAIIMISANAPEGHNVLTPDRAHDDYLMKPIDVRQVLDKVGAALKLEWTYAATDPAVPLESAASPALIEVPAHQHIDDLIDLGRVGHLRGIEAKLHAIEDQCPEHGPFVARMREMVASLDLKRYMAELEALRGDDAH